MNEKYIVVLRELIRAGLSNQSHSHNSYIYTPVPMPAPVPAPTQLMCRIGSKLVCIFTNTIQLWHGINLLHAGVVLPNRGDFYLHVPVVHCRCRSISMIMPIYDTPAHLECTRSMYAQVVPVCQLLFVQYVCIYGAFLLPSSSSKSGDVSFTRRVRKQVNLS